MKHLNENNRLHNPKYYNYYQLVSVPIKQHIMLKDKIMELACQIKINLKEDVMTFNFISITFGCLSKGVQKPLIPYPTYTIQFGSFNLI